ncbi:MAG: hypothetical protein JRE21_01630 [Deltaproteobacteria bacterium]|jgi:hypothetical protein|nr:hypothetical protein [Deltaproteobacteria bacterium]
MKAFPVKSLLSALCALFVLVSCGGGPSTGGGIGGTGIISSGTVSAHGSIFVNGLEFDTSDAVIVVNGVEVGTGDEFVLDYLDIGKVVLVEGTGDMDASLAVADRVTYRDNVAGPVESMADFGPTTKEIVVLGQRVILNVLTIMKGIAFDDLMQDDLVVVSGLVDDTGAIRATFLEKTGEFVPGNIVGVTGFVDNLDKDLETFQINSLTVDYFGIAPADLPEEFAENLLVEVEGTLDVAGGVMTATSIESGDEFDDADQIEVLGFVTNVYSVVDPIEFSIGNQVVQLEANAEFVDGNAANIVLGAKLEAEGYLEDGILYADEIEFWGPDQIEVEGVVTATAPDDSEFTLDDKQVVQTNAGTIFEPLGLDIEEGMMIEVKGVPTDMAYSVIVADKVSLEED